MSWYSESIQVDTNSESVLFQSVKQRLATSGMPQPRWKGHEPDNKTQSRQAAHAQSWSLSLLLTNIHKNPMESILIFPSWAHDAWRCSYFILTQDHGEKRVSYVFARLVAWKKHFKIPLSDMWTQQAQNVTLASQGMNQVEFLTW